MSIIINLELAMEDGSQSSKSNNKKALGGIKKNQATALVVAVVVALAAWGLYSWGVSAGKDQAKKDAQVAAERNQSNQLLTLPASGEVSKVSDDSITLKLLGNETSTAIIDSKTQVTNKSGKAKASDIKVGGKAIVFTKKSGDKRVASKIILQ